MASKMSERLNFKSVEELLGVVNEEAAMDIEIYKISGFKGHPFKVIDDEKMQELVESIKVNGVLSPVLIRPTGMDTYEMISGHRRLIQTILTRVRLNRIISYLQIAIR